MMNMYTCNVALFNIQYNLHSSMRLGSTCFLLIHTLGWYTLLVKIYVCIQWKLFKTNYKGPTQSVLVIGCSSHQDLLTICTLLQQTK